MFLNQQLKTGIRSGSVGAAGGWSPHDLGAGPGRRCVMASPLPRDVASCPLLAPHFRPDLCAWALVLCPHAPDLSGVLSSLSSLSQHCAHPSVCPASRGDVEGTHRKSPGRDLGLPEQGQPCPSPAVAPLLTSAPGTPQPAQLSGVPPPCERQTPGLLQRADRLPSSSARSLFKPRCRQNNVSVGDKATSSSARFCPLPVAWRPVSPGAGGALLFSCCLHIVVGICARCFDHAAGNACPAFATCWGREADSTPCEGRSSGLSLPGFGSPVH